MRALIVAAALMGLAGCVTYPMPVPIQATMTHEFSVTEHAPYLKPGTATLSGQAFLRQQGGGVVTCAGQGVILLPATPFFEEALSHLVAGRAPPEGSAPEGARHLLRNTTCDAQGNFSFNGLPEGAYVVLAQVSWTVGYAQQGGGLKKTVDVPATGETKVLLTDADFFSR